MNDIEMLDVALNNLADNLAKSLHERIRVEKTTTSETEVFLFVAKTKRYIQTETDLVIKTDKVHFVDFLQFEKFIGLMPGSFSEHKIDYLRDFYANSPPDSQVLFIALNYENLGFTGVYPYLLSAKENQVRSRTSKSEAPNYGNNLSRKNLETKTEQDNSTNSFEDLSIIIGLVIGSICRNIFTAANFFLVFLVGFGSLIFLLLIVIFDGTEMIEAGTLVFFFFLTFISFFGWMILKQRRK